MDLDNVDLNPRKEDNERFQKEWAEMTRIQGRSAQIIITRCPGEPSVAQSDSASSHPICEECIMFNPKTWECEGLGLRATFVMGRDKEIDLDTPEIS